MAEKEIVGWFTMHGGQKVPIFSGESKEDAINRTIAKNNEDLKAKQIAKNKEEADRLNDKKPLPKTLPLNSVKSEDANKTSDVLNLRTRQRFKFKDGTEIKNVYVFAGKGCSKEFRDAEKYAERYKKLDIGKADEWQHCAGKATITNGKVTIEREVHWVQGNDGKIREAFIKEYPKKLDKRK